MAPQPVEDVEGEIDGELEEQPEEEKENPEEYEKFRKSLTEFAEQRGYDCAISHILCEGEPILTACA